MVTLIPGNEEDTVWGVAYEINQEDIDTVSNHLDFREKNGYVKKIIKFYPSSDTSLSPFDLTIYVATHDNVSFAGSYLSYQKMFIPDLINYAFRRSWHWNNC